MSDIKLFRTELGKVTQLEANLLRWRSRCKN